MDTNRIYYNPKLKSLARSLRNNATFGEILLWNKLRKKQMKGLDFHRQKPVGNYIVDFFCYSLKLGIEIDGFSHDGKIESDHKRQKDLEDLGIIILRFTEENVRANVDGVAQEILNWIKKHTPPPKADKCPLLIEGNY